MRPRRHETRPQESFLEKSKNSVADLESFDRRLWASPTDWREMNRASQVKDDPKAGPLQIATGFFKIFSHL
jgi:hypothetical protein